MILLILGLLIILVLFYQIYIIKKNEEPFIGTASEIQVAVRNTLCHAKLEEQATFRESISLQNFL